MQEIIKVINKAKMSIYITLLANLVSLYEWIAFKLAQFVEEMS